MTSPHNDDAQSAVRDGQKTPYGIFLAVMTVFSLIATGILALDWVSPFGGHAPQQMVLMLEWVDLFFCAIFLLDWLYSVATARSKLRYLFGQRPGHSLPYGVLELFGTVPFVFVFRLLRLFRLQRMGWQPADLTPAALYRAVITSRTESAILITGIVAFLVVVLGSVFVLFYEYDQPYADITTAGDALWWSLVTITTVGYGDEVPVTDAGRIAGGIAMFVGIGIFGVIAGSLAGLFTSGRDQAQRDAEIAAANSVAAELAALRAEVAALRTALDSGSASVPQDADPQS